MADLIARFNRPIMHAVRVPDNFMQIDGRDDDWRELGDDVQTDCLAASGTDHILAPIPARGAVTGPDDLSMIASVAYDSKYLYIIADVHDSVLLNYGDALSPWEGDDFEVYIDANPPDKRYADAINENDGHYTVVPAHVSLTYPLGLIYPHDKVAGVKCATRLRPFGYTIEWAIPKALLPNWQAHPTMSSVGFDLQVSDADAPGLIGHDPADKAILYLMHPDFHFKSSLTLGELDFDPKMTFPAVTMPRPPAPVSLQHIFDGLSGVTQIPPDELAQDILDNINDPEIGEIVEVASRSTHPSILRAAGLVYARQRAFSIPADGFPDLVPTTAGESPIASNKSIASDSTNHYSDPDDSYYAYALLALAERHQLKADRIFTDYQVLSDPALRLTFWWCLGINGDTSMVPKLAIAYAGSTGQDKLVIAWSLAMLGDRTGAPTLEDAARNDPNQAFGKDAAVLLKQLGMSF